MFSSWSIYLIKEVLVYLHPANFFFLIWKEKRIHKFFSPLLFLHFIAITVSELLKCEHQETNLIVVLTWVLWDSCDICYSHKKHYILVFFLCLQDRNALVQALSTTPEFLRNKVWFLPLDIVLYINLAESLKTRTNLWCFGLKWTLDVFYILLQKPWIVYAQSSQSFLYSWGPTGE